MPDIDRSRSAVVDRIPEDAYASYRGVRGPARPVAGRASRTARRDRLTPGQRARRFVRTYGWRAYALPVLAVVTVIVLAGTLGGHHLTANHPKQGPPVAAGPPTASGDIALKSDSANGNVNNTALSSAALPAGAAYTTTGAGTFRTLPGNQCGVRLRAAAPVHHRCGERHHRDRPQAVPVGGDVDAGRQAQLVGARGVAAAGDDRHYDFHITLTSVMTVRKYCGYDLPIETSCYAQRGTNGLDVNRVLLNNARWVRGDVNYIGDMATYRVYMVNHEDGHALGHQHAHSCLKTGWRRS